MACLFLIDIGSKRVPSVVHVLATPFGKFDSGLRRIFRQIQIGGDPRHAPYHFPAAQSHDIRGALVSAAIYEAITHRIVQALDRGVVPWRKPWHTSSALPTNGLTNHRYRGINILLLALAPFADHRWLSFLQVQQLGGRVTRGERSTTVVFWKPPELKKPEPEEEAPLRRAPILRTYQVFNVEQCQDLKIPPLPKANSIDEQERISRAESLIQSMPCPPTICERGSSAWYRPSDDLVQVPPFATFETPDSYYATLFHELGHATGHPCRLGRSGVIGEIEFGSGKYGHEELVAELTSAFCCGTASLDNSLVENSASYIQSWLTVIKGDPKLVVIAAAQAQRAADFIHGVSRCL